MIAVLFNKFLITCCLLLCSTVVYSHPGVVEHTHESNIFDYTITYLVLMAIATVALRYFSNTKRSSRSSEKGKKS